MDAQLEVHRLMSAREAAGIGMIYVEVLRGARSEEDYTRLRARLGLLRHIEGSESIWQRAGRILFDLRLQGTPIPFPDAIIAAHALEGGHSVFTRDTHFDRVPGLRLHQSAGGAA
jgi:predicted nucleic acid-binding protein